MFGDDIITLLIIVGGMVVLFISNRVPVDLTAVTGLVLLVLTGHIAADGAFIGFSSSAVITMLSTFFLGAALRTTGVGAVIAGLIHRFFGDREVVTIACVMLLAASFSAFMNNVAAVAVLFPAIVSLAHRSSIPPSRLLLPLAYGAVLGGTLTTVGTAPNILVADFMLAKSIEPALGLFDFLPFGAALVGIGTLFVTVVGRKLLPRHATRRRRRRDLARLYKLHERLISLTVPPNSSLVGQTLANARLGDVLDSQAIAIIRGSQQLLAPSPQEVLQANDTLIVRGKISNVKNLLRFQGLQVRELPSQEASAISSVLTARGYRLVERGLKSWTLKDLKFRKRFGVMVAAIQRNDRYIHRGLAREPLDEGDVIHAIGTPEQLESLAEDPYFSAIESPVSVADFLQHHLFIVALSDSSPLAGTTLAESKLGESMGFTIVGVLRDGKPILPPPIDSALEPGDELLVAGEAGEVMKLGQLGELIIDSSDVTPTLESRDIGIMEVVLSPRSSLLRRTLKELRFREKYGFQVLALWREGRPVRSRVGTDELRFGDALLLQGSRKKMPLLAEDPDFVVLTEDIQAPERKHKSWFALIGIILMVGLATSGAQPVHMAAFTAAVFVVLAGAVTMEEAYREIEWRVVFLVACMIPIGLAVKDSGAAEVFSRAMVSTVGPYGPMAVLIALSLTSSILSQVLDGSLTVILLGPVGLEAANSMQVSPLPMLMAIALSASVAFLTPFSHKAGLLVMGAGGYRVRDYFRIGLLLSILCFATLWVLIPILYPFR